MSSIQLKVFFHGDGDALIRRFSIKPDLTWKAVKDRVNKMFDTADAYQMQYVDPDGDKVLVSSQEEWEECLAVVRGTTVLHLHLHKVQPSRNKVANKARRGTSLPHPYNFFSKLCCISFAATPRLRPPRHTAYLLACVNRCKRTSVVLSGGASFARACDLHLTAAVLA